MKKLQYRSLIVRGLLGVLAATFSTSIAKATPYASCISNNVGTISFILNEAGGNVTITYEDGSTNANFNGITTGTNQPAGISSFSLTGHTSYTISVFKSGSGAASVITTIARGTARGLAVNQNGASPYFGRVYSAIGGAGIVIGNSDGSLALTGAKPSGFWNANTFSPNKLSIAADDSVIVSDFSTNHAGVWSFDPNFTSNQLLLGPIGTPAGIAANSHGSQESQPILTGSIVNGNAVLTVVDGDFPSSQLNSILTYNIGPGPLPWQNAPDIIGAQINPQLIGDNNTGGFGFSAGLSRGTNGYLYVNVSRANLSNPNLAVYDSTGTTSLWNSFINGGTADYVVNTYPGGTTKTAPSDSALSPDNQYIAIVHLDNHLSIVSLTNGIPDLSTLYTVQNPGGQTGNGRGIAWDVAGNLWTSSSGLGNVQQWSLGRTATAITTGNASGPTGFQLIPAANVVTISNAQPIASQSNGYGNPTTATNVITRTGSLSSPLLVNFVVSGTAANGTYVISQTNSVTLAAGQASTNVTVTAVNDSIARPTTTVILTLTGGSGYSVGPFTAVTDYIVNTAPDQLVVAAAAPTMYKAFSNDFASFTITRWGDTNAATFTASTFTYGGTGVAGTDYTLPAAVTFNPGDIAKTVTISPLVGGVPPVDSTSVAYTGNKTAVIGLSAGTGYTATNTATLTIIDNANPPATVLWSNPLTDPNDATNWAATYANNDLGDATFSTDYEASFGYDLTSDPSGAIGLIPLPPSGATNALRVTVNKLGFPGAPGANGAINLYPTNVSFNGSYAVRFNMNVIQASDTTRSTEGPLFGVNHMGTMTNWFAGSGFQALGGANGPVYPWAADGLWYFIDARPGGITGSLGGDYLEYTGAGGTNGNSGWMFPLPGQTVRTPFANAFKTAVFPVSAGLPVNSSPLAGGSANNWSDVEIKQIQDNTGTNYFVTMSINKTVIFTYTNRTVWNSGTLMLGYEDPFDDVTSLDGAAYFSNLRVVRLGPPSILGAVVTGGNSVINFASTDGTDSTASFTVQQASVVTGPYTDVSPAATITQNSVSGIFQATVPVSGPIQFYRIRHK